MRGENLERFTVWSPIKSAKQPFDRQRGLYRQINFYFMLVRLLFSLFTLLLVLPTTQGMPTTTLPREGTTTVPPRPLSESENRLQRRLNRIEAKLDRKIERMRSKRKARRMDRSTRNWVILGGAALLLLLILGAGGFLSNILGLILGIILVVALILAAAYLILEGI